MAEMVERKIRRRARQIYDTRGQEEGRSLEDWFKAESEVLKSSVLAPVYRKVRVETAVPAQIDSQDNGDASA